MTHKKDEMDILCENLTAINTALENIVHNVHIRDTDYIKYISEIEDGFGHMLNYIISIKKIDINKLLTNQDILDILSK